MYNLNKKSIEIENITKSFYQIQNIDEALDDLLLKSPDHIDIIDERLPYWMSLWESAIALSKYIIKNKEKFKNKEVLEIGAGLALPSLFASDYCKEICVSDYLPEALEFAKRNCALNNVTNVSYSLLDWRNITIDEKKYDFILGSDIAYEKRFHAELPIAIDKLMKDDGVCIMADPSRKNADVFFNQQLPLHFDVRKMETEKINDRVWVRLFEIKRKIR